MSKALDQLIKTSKQLVQVNKRALKEYDEAIDRIQLDIIRRNQTVKEHEEVLEILYGMKQKGER